MSNFDFQEKFNNLTITSYEGRLLGIFFNPLDIPFMFGVFFGGTIAGKYGAFVFGVAYFVVQLFLATKGYTVSKFILGRKVLSKKTLDKANPAIIMIRPLLAQAWMGCMMGLYFVFFAFGAAFASLFHRQENTVYDSAYNDAMTASMAAGSVGLLSSVFVKFPNLVWLHDTLMQTLVVSVPYSQVKDEVFAKKTIETAEIENNKAIEKDAA